jgi:probable F420-dependent oxidoreductase
MLEIDFRKSIVDAGANTRVDNALNFAEEIERLGYGGLWHGHFIVREVAGLDTLGVLTAVAARTKRIMLGTAILQAPLYHPVDLARRLVTIDQISGGRLILGVGLGASEREYDNLGIPFKQRGSRLDESLDLLKRLWTEDNTSYEGRYFKVKDLVVLPKPIQQPHPKIVVGGVWHGGIVGRAELGSTQEWSERSISRVARYGDGWITMSTIPVARAADILAEGVERIKDRARELGRTLTDEDLLIVGETGMININDSRSQAAAESEQFYGVRVARGYHQSRGNPSLETHMATGCTGTADEVADFMRQWIAVKQRVPALKRIQVNFGSIKLMEQLHRFHDEVMPLIQKDLAEAQGTAASRA